MIDALDIGYAIKDRRAQLNLTQAQVAEAAGISKRCLWSLERGQNRGVQFDKLLAVLKTLGLDLSIQEAGADFVPRPANCRGKNSSLTENPSLTNLHNDLNALAILTGEAK